MKRTEVTSGFFKSFDQTSHYYESRGSGEPIIFVYGIGCLMNHWKFQIEHFSKNHRVITYDLRGHHKSELHRPFNNLNIQSLGLDLKALCEHLGIKKAVFVGHSFGVQILVEFSSLNNKLIDKLILINGFAKNPILNGSSNENLGKLISWVRNRFEEHPIEFLILWKKLINNPLAMIIAGLTGGFNLSKTPFKEIEIYANGVSKLDLGIFLTLFESMISYNGVPKLKNIKVPTLIISGTKDRITPVEFQKELNSKIKKSEFRKIEEGSHCTQLDFPKDVNQLIEDFIKQ